jgi:hypothetical protein
MYRAHSLYTDPSLRCSMSRPELQAPAEVFYGETEARKYLHNSRMIQVQGQMAERALEMLNLVGSYHTHCLRPLAVLTAYAPRVLTVIAVGSSSPKPNPIRI